MSPRSLVPSLPKWLRKQRLPVLRRVLRVEFLEDRCLLSTWFPVGPAPILNGNVPGHQPLSGRITGIAADPTDPKTIYIGSAGGGVWKTTDAGASWTPLTDTQPTLVMGAMAVAPSDPNVIYAGTGEPDGTSVNFLANYSPTTFYGRGVLKSADAGKTWTLLGNDVFDRRSIARVVVDPKDADVAYVAVGQPGFNGLTGNQGIWLTTDGGKSWTNTTAASGIRDTLAFSDLVMDPSDNQHLYAAAGDPNGSVNNGLYETTDGGQTWVQNTAFFSSSARVGRIALAISPTDPLRLYGSIAQGGSIGGALLAMLRSDDGGVSWTALHPPAYLGGQGNYDTTLAVDPSDPDRVYAGGQGADSGPMQPLGVIESTDAGQTWAGIAVGASGKDGPHNDHHAVAFDANGRLLDGNDAGIWRLDNPDVGKIQWTDLNTNLQITTLIGIDVHPTDPTIAYGGSQDTGTEIYSGDPAWTEVVAHDGGAIWVNRDNPNIIYHYTLGANGATFERSDDGGQTWMTKTTGLGFGGNFFPPVVLDPSNSNRLVIGTGRVYETTDQAEHWTPINTPGTHGWTVFGPIDSVAVAPSDPDTLYASTSTNAGAQIFVTNDHGQNWVRRDVPVMLAHDHFFDLKVDPNDPQTAYAVRGIFGGGHVYQTTDGGQTWTDISGNLPDLPAFSLVIGPGILFLGTDAGVYATVDGGKDWEPFGDGMPTFQVKQLVLNTNYNILAAGTHGRGMWEISLDDLNPRGRSAVQARPGHLEKPFPLATLAAPAHQPSLAEGGNTALQGDIAAPRLAEIDGFFARPAPVQGGVAFGRPALQVSATVFGGLEIDAGIDLLPSDISLNGRSG